jgi:hypothetical protein
MFSRNLDNKNRIPAIYLDRGLDKSQDLDDLTGHRGFIRG